MSEMVLICLNLEGRHARPDTHFISSSARRSLRMMTPRARSSAAASMRSLMSRTSFDMSLCQSSLTTASGASRRRWEASSGVGTAADNS